MHNQKHKTPHTIFHSAVYACVRSKHTCGKCRPLNPVFPSIIRERLNEHADKRRGDKECVNIMFVCLRSGHVGVRQQHYMEGLYQTHRIRAKIQPLRDTTISQKMSECVCVIRNSC